MSAVRIKENEAAAEDLNAISLVITVKIGEDLELSAEEQERVMAIIDEFFELIPSRYFSHN